MPLIVKFKLADKLVLGNVRQAMGGPKTVLACGGAPLRKEIEEFLFACGLLVLQGYGLTETTAGDRREQPGRGSGSAPSAR